MSDQIDFEKLAEELNEASEALASKAEKLWGKNSDISPEIHRLREIHKTIVALHFEIARPDIEAREKAQSEEQLAREEKIRAQNEERSALLMRLRTEQGAKAKEEAERKAKEESEAKILAEAKAKADAEVSEKAAILAKEKHEQDRIANEKAAVKARLRLEMEVKKELESELLK